MNSKDRTRQLILPAKMGRALRAFLCLALFAAIVFPGHFAFADSPGAAPPIKVVVVSGSNHDMGLQYGEQAADLIAANLEATWNILDNQVAYFPGGPLVGHDVIMKDLQVWTYYLEKYDPKLLDWLNGISQGCKNKGHAVTYTDLVALMVLPQELWARPGMPYPNETQVAALKPIVAPLLLAKTRTDTRAISSCTSFAATGKATTDGKAMISLTLGFIADIKQYVILHAFPADGYPFVSLTMAGKVSNNSGMNKNFGWVMTAAVTDPFGPCASSWGVPSEAYHHYLQQYCKSPADAMKYIKETPRGGVTGNFVFADRFGEVLIYEVGSCAAVVRRPGDLGETDWIATTNNYNGTEMTQYAIPSYMFPDTYVRYDTIFKSLSSVPAGKIDLDFAKASWLSNKWYDVTTNTWNEVPVPNDPNDLNTCNVPGNNCEGGESQIVQFPGQRIAYLQPGGPHGTSIKYYWPDNPKPTGEYTKWQLSDSIDRVADKASDDALTMIMDAQDALRRAWHKLDGETRGTVNQLLNQATQSWWKGKMAEAMVRYDGHGHHETQQKTQNAKWGAVCTDYATAQLYAQMVTTKLRKK